MIIKAVAKVNLGLDVVSEREDGYHEVRMIMQTVAMHDLVEMKVTAGKPGIRLEADIPYIPTDDKNLAVRAAALLMIFGPIFALTIGSLLRRISFGVWSMTICGRPD